MTASPPVAIGLPVFNGERYLGETIESVLGQRFGDFSLVICDNASTDATGEICRDYAARDGRITYHRNAENLGAAANYNLTFQRSSSEFFKWAAADDLLAPEFLDTCVEALRAAPPSVGLVYPRALMIDADGNAIGPYDDGLDLRQPSPCARLRTFARRWSLGNPVFGLARRSTLARTGLIRPFAASDIVLLGELGLLGEVHELPQRLFLRRVHAAMSRQANVTQREVAAWFDPAGGRRHWVRGRTLVFLYLLRLVASSESLPVSQRGLCCMSFSGSWAARRARVRLGRLRRLARERIAGAR